jgi:phage/plasmid-like protein (TIGR03299 family)
MPGTEIVLPTDGMMIAGLDWQVEKYPVFLSDGTQVPDSFAVTRTDKNIPLGIVGARYETYQNHELFGFMDRFCEHADSSLETCGSLRNGKTVWALTRPTTTEYLRNDPIKKFFLAKSSHDGTSAVEILFTDVRVVCNNTLTAALKGTKSRVAIHHTASMRATLDQVETVLKHHSEHQIALAQAMDLLVRTQMDTEKINQLVKTLTKSRHVAVNLEEALTSEAEGKDPKAFGEIIRLVEEGKGTDIPGVRGSAYGVLNAVTEYVDHVRKVRGSDYFPNEGRFETAILGTGARMKQQAFDLCLKMAA